MSKYRIIEKAGSFYIQTKLFFFWIDLEDKQGYRRTFPTKESASIHIDSLVFQDKVVIHEYKPRTTSNL